MYTQFFFVCILCNICYVHTKRAVYTHNTCSADTQHVQCLHTTRAVFAVTSQTCDICYVHTTRAVEFVLLLHYATLP